MRNAELMGWRRSATSGFDPGMDIPHSAFRTPHFCTFRIPHSAFRLVSRGPLAQRLEQRTHNPSVPGSNPGGPTAKARYTTPRGTAKGAGLRFVEHGVLQRATSSSGG